MVIYFEATSIEAAVHLERFGAALEEHLDVHLAGRSRAMDVVLIGSHPVGTVHANHFDGTAVLERFLPAGRTRRPRPDGSTTGSDLGGCANVEDSGAQVLHGILEDQVQTLSRGAVIPVPTGVQ